ncbi:MAG: rhomboid family intramembrane serine protease [Planctomycetaceae bacterium]|jgi:membrane associated rhomboid family serine protease
MGLYDREYYRDEKSFSDYWAVGGSVCRQIVLVTGIIYVLQALSASRDLTQSPVTAWLEFTIREAFDRFQVWRLVTYAFVHDENSLWHVVGNMLMLWFFGPDVEGIYGSREFLRFYLSAAVFSVAVQAGVTLVSQQPDLPVVGASGAVLAVMMLYAMHFPRRRVYVFGILPLEVRWLAVVCLVYNLFPVLNSLVAQKQVGAVAYGAHLGGMAFGWLYHHFELQGRLWGWFDRLLDRQAWGRRRRQNKTLRSGNLKVHQPEEATHQPDFDTESEEEFKERVDDILRKISAQGESSLTKRERAVLTEAAQRFKRGR